LGYWIVANIFKLVASKVGYENHVMDAALFLINRTYPDPLSVGSLSKFSTKSKCSTSWHQTWKQLRSIFIYTGFRHQLHLSLIEINGRMKTEGQLQVTAFFFLSQMSHKQFLPSLF